MQARAGGYDRERDGVAIVGVALRFPGARTPDAYWDLLRSGRTAVRRFDREELAAAGVSHERLDHPDFVPVCAALDDIDRFAPERFGMTAAEALVTAPQQRILLEVVDELLIVSGYERPEPETTVGVYASSGMHLSFLNTYLLNELLGVIDRGDPLAAMQVMIGNESDFAATRVAYRLGLTGPAIGVQTACSSSLVAVHLACQALRAGDCDLAVVGGAAVQVPQPNGHIFRRGAILSPSGTCRPFDADADGTVGGSGVAAILLKPLAAARVDGDAIHAIVRGSAVNNDGASKSAFMAPSSDGQATAIRRALACSGIASDSVGYVQAHGTGTRKGDPIELRALTRAFAGRGDGVASCLLSSVKANVGHLDTCAGLAGLIAASLALEHGQAPPQRNFRSPNPDLALDDGPFRIPLEPEPIPARASPPRALVIALGVGGTNAHVVLEAAA